MKKLFKILLISLGIVLIPIIGVAVLIYATAFSDWWVKFPEPQKSQIALARMESLGSGLGCRDNCLGDKITYRAMIMKELEKRGYESGVGKLMLEQVSWGSKSEDFRREIIGLVRDNEDRKKEKNSSYSVKIPLALMEYLNKNGGSPAVKSQILSSFPEDAGASDVFISNLLSLAQDKSKSFEERGQAMTDLSDIMNDYEGTNEEPVAKYKNLDYVSVCDVFLTVAENEKGKTREELYFKQRALNSMNSCLQYKDFYKEDFFNRLKNIFYEEGVHPGIQREIMTEFSYYDRVDLEKYLQLMKEVNSNKENNKIIRSDADYKLKKYNIIHEVFDFSDEEYEKLKNTLSF